MVELFVTVAEVKRAEVQYEANARSKGSGVVEFNNDGDAELAISKFQGYNYGGRPLGLSYAKYPGQDDGMMDAQPSGSMQDQMM